MENNKRIQYALAFSVIAILVFQSFSNIHLQSVYAISYQTIDTPPSGVGSNSLIVSSVRSGDTIFYLGKITSVSSSNNWFNVTAIDANTHAVKMSTGTCGKEVHCSFGAFSQLLPCEGCELTANGDSVYLYTNNGLKQFNGTGLIANTIPCTDASSFLHLLHQKVYLSIYEISSFCKWDDKVWTEDGQTLGTLHLSPSLEDIGGANKCPQIYDAFIDSSNNRVVALCHNVGSATTLNLYSYSNPSLSDLTLKSSLSLHNFYRYLATSGNNYSFLTVTSIAGSSHPPIQVSLSDSEITIFHTFPLSGGQQIPLFIPNPSSPSAIGVLWIYDTQNRLMSGFLPHNSTSLSTDLCDNSDCASTVFTQLPLSYDFDDRNFFYSGGYTSKKIIVWNSTEDTRYIYEIDTTSGNGTGGNGGSGNNTNGNTCDFSDPACTIPKQVGHGLCVFHLFDCDTNDDIKTNGVGFLLLIVMLGLLIVFFAILRKKANLQIHPIIWVGGMLAVFGLAVGAQIIEGYWFILAIVVIVAFGGFNVWNSRRGDS